MPATPIAVAISTRNRPEALRRCLESLRRGQLLPSEVVVTDQSHGPETRVVVQEAHEAGMPIRYVRARAGGLGASQNDAVATTTAALITVIDDDCIADEAWLAEIARAFDEDDDLALLGGAVLPLGPDAPDAYPVSTRTSTHPRDFLGPSPPWDVGSGNNFALRREWFERIGGCDERLGPGAPLRGGLDMDLFYRLLRAGGRARYEPRVVVLHERATRQGMLERASDYGYGMAAAIGIWLRSGDRFGWAVLGAWLRMRTRLLALGLLRGRWLVVQEEALVLRGTVQGLLRVWFAPPRRQETR